MTSCISSLVDIMEVLLQRRMEFLEYPSMSCELRGAMSSGQLKMTDEKIIFTHSRSGRKDTLKVTKLRIYAVGRFGS